MNFHHPIIVTPLSLVEASLIGSEIERIVDMQQNKCEVIRTCTISRIVDKCLDI